eukprot:4586469-Pleurochrysis_carterae.AAC.1
MRARRRTRRTRNGRRTQAAHRRRSARHLMLPRHAGAIVRLCLAGTAWRELRDADWNGVKRRRGEVSQ